MGKIAFIDLATQQYTISEISDNTRRLFLGGRGINMWLLYQLLGPETKPLDPDNVLIFGTGILTGTTEIATSRFNISGKSPETGLLGDSSAGGHFGPELRFAGFDHLVFMHKSAKPVYVWIHNGNIEFVDASSYVELDVFELQDALRRELGDDQVQIATCGPAGRKMAAMSCIVTGYHGGNSAGRTGMGAIMGSKNLVAVAVRGSQALPVAYPKYLMAVVAKHYNQIQNSKGYQAMATYGTLARLNNSRQVGFEGGLNHQINMVIQGGEELDADVLTEKYEIGKRACFNCPIHCKHIWRIQDGPRKGLSGIGIEYYGAGGFGSMCGCGSWDTILEAFDLCNRNALDISSTSGYIAWSMELWQRGILTAEDTDGLTLEWGSREAIIGLINQIMDGRSWGGLLARGWRAAAKAIGKNAGHYMNHIKNLSIEPDDVRAFKGKTLGIATSTRGSDHLRSRYTMEEYYLPPDYVEELIGRPVPRDPDSYDDSKAYATYWSECLCAVVDSLGMCKFVTKWLSPGLMAFNEFSEVLHASVGLELSPVDLMEIGERIYNMERMFIVREGVTRADDNIPWRLQEPYQLGPRKGARIDPEKFQGLLSAYYQVHGWDLNGVPLEETLNRLKITDALAAVSESGGVLP